MSMTLTIDLMGTIDTMGSWRDTLDHMAEDARNEAFLAWLMGVLVICVLALLALLIKFGQYGVRAVLVLAAVAVVPWAIGRLLGEFF